MEKQQYLFSFARYRRSERTAESLFPLERELSLPELKADLRRQVEKSGGIRNVCTIRMLKNIPYRAGFGIQIRIPDWSREHYVFAPAALYNGNRFPSVERSYPPAYTARERADSSAEIFITDVPRLPEDGGRVQLNTGDLATPCIGYYDPKGKTGYLLFCGQGNSLGNLGLTFQEDLKKGEAVLTLSTPCVRQKKYAMCTTQARSDDRGALLRRGARVVLAWEEITFPCESRTAFLRAFFRLRIRPGVRRTHPDGVPWSAAYRVIEDKYNARNWVEQPGFYKSSEAASGHCRQWQTGWVGGTMNTLPGLIVGSEQTQERSRRTLDFVFRSLQAPSGFLYGIYCDGRPFGDDFDDPANADIVMSRKNADALYFIARHLLWLKSRRAQVPDLWLTGCKKLADAFVSFYQTWGELGQLIDIGANRPYVHGTSAAGLAPAGLVLCARLFGEDSYRTCAAGIAEQLYRTGVAQGYTTGGPGEILGCPDSESAFALLESFTVLYEETGEERWLRYAEDAAALSASWCVSYDYHYAPDTQFARRGVATTGAVWANVQNKHAAPGICTLSGASLFRLYRATGEVRYLELCRDIAHNITQYLSTRENPIYSSYVWGGPAHLQKRLNARAAALLYRRSGAQAALFNAPGRMNERVNLSDWEGTNNVGEVPHGSCWCEVSAMLTYLEIPAAYIQPDTGFCFALDHLICRVEARTERGMTVRLENPTAYDADYRLLVEDSAACASPLGDPCLWDFYTVHLPAHGAQTLTFERRMHHA